MELNAVGPAVEAERLDVRRRSRQHRGAGRRVEGVAVPVKSVELAGKAGPQGIAGALGGQLDGGPADLLTGLTGVHLAADRGGQQLGAETDPEDRVPQIEEALDQLDLTGQEGEAVHLVRAHGAAEHDEAHNVVQVLIHTERRCVDVAELDPSAPQPLAEVAQAFDLHMLYDRAVHGVAGCLRRHRRFVSWFTGFHAEGDSPNIVEPKFGTRCTLGNRESCKPQEIKCKSSPV